MKNILFLILGLFFGIILTKSEVISWFRIQEMFRFDSFHMYGVIGSAVILGAILVQLVKRFKLQSIEGEKITIKEKAPVYKSALIGGIIFGLGWALTGACPGPIYSLIGGGYSVYIVVLIAAVFGALLYGLLRPRLPH